MYTEGLAGWALLERTPCVCTRTIPVSTVVSGWCCIASATPSRFFAGGISSHVRRAISEPSQGAPPNQPTVPTPFWRKKLNELGTNAAKYGALSLPGGSVRILWEFDTDDTQRKRLRLSWQESGGPPVEKPRRQGFGMLILTQLSPMSLGATATLAFDNKGV